MIRRRPLATATALTATLTAATLALTAAPGMAQSRVHPRAPLASHSFFTMKPDGSSGVNQGGDGIPNIDSVKSTIRTYYQRHRRHRQQDQLAVHHRDDGHRGRPAGYLAGLPAADQAARKKLAIVFDADDTTLWTYDMEDAGDALHLRPGRAGRPTSRRGGSRPRPGWSTSSTRSRPWASRSSASPVATTTRRPPRSTTCRGRLHRLQRRQLLHEVDGQPATASSPSYVTRATAAKCTTVEYKAGTRKHIEDGPRLDIVLNVGDQFSDLQGGYADKR